MNAMNFSTGGHQLLSHAKLISEHIRKVSLFLEPGGKLQRFLVAASAISISAESIKDSDIRNCDWFWSAHEVMTKINAIVQVLLNFSLFLRKN